MAFHLFPSLDLGGALMKVAPFFLWGVQDTGLTISSSLYVCSFHLSGAYLCSHVFSYTFHCLFLTCPGLSFNCALLLLAVPICLRCHLITFRYSFQFNHSFFRVSSRFHLMSHHQQNSSVQSFHRSTFYTINNILDTKPKQRNCIPGLFQVALNQVKCPWHRVCSIMLTRPNTLASYKVPPSIIQIRISWEIGNR